MRVYIANIKDNNKKDLSNQILEHAYNDMCGKKIDVTKIHKNQYGKPYYDNKFFYNISHSKNYICVAVDKDEVGIDIEEPRYINSDLPKRILKSNEKIIGGNILNNWVLKEAYTKYLGVGLYIDFRNISTDSIIKSENVTNLSTRYYYCFLVSKKPANVEIVHFNPQ
jgi:4'-phosphopantetheinyl transferase